MISKNSARSIENKEEAQINNRTSIKQKGSMFNVNEFVYSPSIGQSRSIVEDQPIEYEPQFKERRQPQISKISPERRSLIKQNQLWHTEQKDMKNSNQDLKYISQQYYGQNVPNQTLAFLEKIRNLMIKQEELLLKKRKDTMHSVIASIRMEFSKIREELFHLVEAWCKKTEEEQIEYFIKKGEMSMNGQIVELYGKTVDRRGEVDAKIQQINEVLSEHQIVNKEQGLKGNHYIKKTIRQVWARNYEMQVSQLQEERYRLQNHQSSFHFLPIRGEHYQNNLHFLISNLLQHYQLFKSMPKVPETPMSTIKNESKAQQAHGNLLRDRLINDLLQQRMKEINYERNKIAIEHGL